MHRFVGSRVTISAWLAAAVIVCLSAAWAAPADAQQAKAAVKSGEVVPMGKQAGSSGQAKPAVPPAETSKPAGENKKDGPGVPPPPGERQMSTTIKEPADYGEAVRVALVQSPLLVKSALEIETKRLDVQDAWSTFIPTVSINTTYWFRMPTKIDGTTDKPYTISFSTGQWNPILSGFEVKARNEMTNIAILGHLKVIGIGLKRLGTDFLQLSVIEEQHEVIKKRIELARMNLEFYKTRLSMGQATKLDIRIAETRMEMAKAEEDKLAALRNMVMDDIKFILGVPFTHKLKLDVAKAKKQILGEFSPADVSDEKVRQYSFDLRMQEYEKRLQQKNIGLSYVKLLPSFGFTFQTVDAFNNTNTNTNRDGFPFYPGINISLPLDYWTKGRDIARQYKKLDQVHAATRAKEFELVVTVQKAFSEYQTANSDFIMANSQLELTKLQDEQTEYRHKTGQAEFDKLVADRNEYYTAWQKMLLQKMKRETALLELKYLNGDLQNQYIDVEAWEK